MIEPICWLPAIRAPTTDEASVASSTVDVSALTWVTVPTRPWPLSTVSWALTPSLCPTSRVTVSL